MATSNKIKSCALQKYEEENVFSLLMTIYCVCITNSVSSVGSETTY